MGKPPINAGFSSKPPLITGGYPSLHRNPVLTRCVHGAGPFSCLSVAGKRLWKYFGILLALLDWRELDSSLEKIGAGQPPVAFRF